MKRVFKKEGIEWKKEYEKKSKEELYKIYKAFQPEDKKKNESIVDETGYSKKVVKNIKKLNDKETYENMLNKKRRNSKSEDKKEKNSKTKSRKKSPKNKKSKIDISKINNIIPLKEEEEDEIKEKKKKRKSKKKEKEKEKKELKVSNMSIKLEGKIDDSLVNEMKITDKERQVVIDKEEEMKLQKCRQKKDINQKIEEFWKHEEENPTYNKNPYMTKETEKKYEDYDLYENPYADMVNINDNNLNEKKENESDNIIKKNLQEENVLKVNILKDEKKYELPENINKKESEEKNEIINIEEDIEEKMKDSINIKSIDVNSYKKDKKLKEITVEEFSFIGSSCSGSSSLKSTPIKYLYEKPEEEYENRLYRRDPETYVKSKIGRIRNRYFPMRKSFLDLLKEVIKKDPLRYIQKNNRLNRDYINTFCGYDNMANKGVNRFRYDLITGWDGYGRKNWGNRKYFLFVRPGYFDASDMVSDILSLETVNTKLYFGLSTFGIRTRYVKPDEYNYITYFYLKFKESHHLPRTRFNNWLLIDADDKKMDQVRTGLYGTMYIIQRYFKYTEEGQLDIKKDMEYLNNLIHNTSAGKIVEMSLEKRHYSSSLVDERLFGDNVWERYNDYTFDPYSD